MPIELPQLDCRACGACCMDAGVPPYTLLELYTLPASLRSLVTARAAADPHPGETPCYFFDPATGRCTEYDHRPRRCQDEPVGGVLCRTARLRKGLLT